MLSCETGCVLRWFDASDFCVFQFWRVECFRNAKVASFYVYIEIYLSKPRPTAASNRHSGRENRPHLYGFRSRGKWKQTWGFSLTKLSQTLCWRLKPQWTVWTQWAFYCPFGSDFQHWKILYPYQMWVPQSYRMLHGDFLELRIQEERNLESCPRDFVGSS